MIVTKTMLTQEVTKVSLHYLWCRGKVFITTSHVHPAKPQPRFSAGLSLTFNFLAEASVRKCSSN